VLGVTNEEGEVICRKKVCRDHCRVVWLSLCVVRIQRAVSGSAALNWRELSGISSNATAVVCE
jgi:hypothetical protein